jgi:acylaminoacyl-peptidase
MAAVTDIPNWVYAVAGVLYEPSSAAAMTSEVHENVTKMSPVAHVDKIKCPIQFQIGDKDLRVPPSQGYSMYYALKARGVPVE